MKLCTLATLAALSFGGSQVHAAGPAKLDEIVGKYEVKVGNAVRLEFPPSEAEVRYETGVLVDGFVDPVDHWTIALPWHEGYPWFGRREIQLYRSLAGDLFLFRDDSSIGHFEKLAQAGKGWEARWMSWVDGRQKAERFRIRMVDEGGFLIREAYPGCAWYVSPIGCAFTKTSHRTMRFTRIAGSRESPSSEWLARP